MRVLHVIKQKYLFSDTILIDKKSLSAPKSVVQCTFHRSNIGKFIFVNKSTARVLSTTFPPSPNTLPPNLYFPPSPSISLNQWSQTHGLRAARGTFGARELYHKMEKCQIIIKLA